MQKQAPRLSVRPVFDPGLVTVEAGVAGVAGAAVSFFLLATFFFILIILLGLNRVVPAGFLYGFFFLLGGLGAPVLYFELKKKAHAKTVYNFYDDYFEYQNFEFYITKRRRRVRYIDVTDVNEHANVFQTRRLLTSVYIEVPRMARQQRSGFAGVKISDVPERLDLADKITALIEEGQRRYYTAAPAEKNIPAAPAEKNNPPPPAQQIQSPGLSAADLFPEET